MKIHAVFLVATLASPLCYGQFRCVENGKTVLTDKPCAAPTAVLQSKANSLGDAANSAYSTTSGTWRGQVQFMAKAGTGVVNEAHSVAPIVLEIDPRGKVTGSSTETGCVFKGIAIPGIADTITNLDVTLTKCSYPGYNRQLSGRLALYRAKSYVDFSVVAYDMQKRPPMTYEIKGTLRR